MSVVSTCAATKGCPNSANVVLGYEFDGSDKGYPFLLDVHIKYELDAYGLHVEVAATNRDSSGWPLPFYNGWHPYFLGDISTSRIVLDPCTKWTHVDVHEGKQYPPPRFSDMVPSTHVSAWHKNNGTDVVGVGNASAGTPTYMDDEVKALTPNTCTGSKGFTTRLVDVASGQTVALDHGIYFRYLQIYTGSKAGGG